MNESNRTTITLPSHCRSNLHGIAFDGCYVYITAPQECCIYKLKQDFTLQSCIKTEKPYGCICYDYKENCFWVTDKKHHDAVYKLNCSMKEVGLLHIKECQRACSPVIGLSYNCENDTLLAAYKDLIVQVSKDSGRTCIIREACEESYTSVLSIAPYYAIVRQDRKEQTFQILTREGHKVKGFCIPDLYTIRDILFYPCNQRCHDDLEFILLATKDNCCENILYKINICDTILCSCNYEVCCTHCGDDKTERCICDAIESVALIETSLSHILNAEGEKLQKAVELADSVDELLAINKSVTKTIINITQMEYNLYLKLDTLNDLRKTHTQMQCPKTQSKHNI